MSKQFNKEQMQEARTNFINAKEQYQTLKEEAIQSIFSFLKANAPKAFTAAELSKEFGLPSHAIAECISPDTYTYAAGQEDIKKRKRTVRHKYAEINEKGEVNLAKIITKVYLINEYSYKGKNNKPAQKKKD